MYSGTTLTRYSGHVLGAHQRIDRMAFRHLKRITELPADFPAISTILHFEGKNGPDGIKSKSTGTDEPWHFYDPFNPDDTQLLDIIQEHYDHLVKEVRRGNRERTAFEASWLAHALVDGLTPAHHFPYEEELEKLRGEGKESRNTIRNKLIIKGDNLRDTARRNWTMWGAKGLFTSHGLFEMGVATLMLPMRLREAAPQEEDFKRLAEDGLVEFFKYTARHVAELDMFKRYIDSGWTAKLANEVRHELAPRLVVVVTLAWYAALQDASKAGK